MNVFFPSSPSLRSAVLALFAATMISGCSGTSDDREKNSTAQVGYIEVQPSVVPVSVTLSGRTVAFETSEVRPQVTGVIVKRLFTEGSMVKAGQPLYQIDPSLYRAAVNQAQADLSSASATAEAAEAKAKRFKPLADMEAVARQDYIDALATARSARASVAQNAAALDTAKINLRFTTLPAPISGQIGRSIFTVGALVSSTQASPLAVIQRMDPIFVDMQQSAGEITALRRKLGSGGVNPGSTEVRLKFEDGSTYPLAGVVQFSEVTVGADTGTVTLRARFPNPDGLLLPGMFVSAVFDQASDPNAFLIPQAAVQRDFNGAAYVMVAGADGKAVRRQVTADRTSGPSAVVTAGLERGDKVIVQGLNGLKQGAEIKAVPANTPQKIMPPKSSADKRNG